MSSLTKVLAEEVRKTEETAAVARTMQTKSSDTSSDAACGMAQ